MSISYSRSIRKKLILLLTATASLMVLIACSTLWVYQLIHYRATLRTEEAATAQVIADSSAPALLFGDVRAANETLSVLRADPRIEMACLYDKSGRAVAHFLSMKVPVTCPGPEPASFRFTDHNLIIFKSIEVQGELIGQLYLRVSLFEMYELLKHFAETGLFVLLVTTIFALALSSLLERLISSPILHLTRIATQVSEQGNYLLRAKHASDDETGVLIDQFNLMMDRIQEREAELQNAHRDLEAKVKERTLDLRTEISERKVIERDLETAKVAAEESNRAKSAFLANMSHELRTPLNAIIGYSEMLLEDAVSTSAVAMSKDLEKILRSARHLLTLISEILDLSKIEAGQMELFPEHVLAASLLHDVLSTAEVLAKRNRNKLFQIEPIWHGAMLVDPLRFRQCLLNLISNSCKFTEDGVISIAVEQGFEAGQPWILWKVRDTGVGISPENRAKLFRSFSQVDSSATRRFGGSGLGLAISQQLCQAMGGFIRVESEVGQGSTFTIYIPDTESLLQQDGKELLACV
jgi:signal transduction histidine kinase